MTTMRVIAKMIKRYYVLFVSLCALPIAVVLIIWGKLAIYLGAYSEVSMVTSKIPFMLGEKVRFFYYKATLKHLGNGVIFRFGSFCQYPTASIGNRVLIGYYNAIGEVTMGDDIVIGGFVNFISGTNQHSFEDPDKLISNQHAKGRQMITIGSDVWIGSNAVITCDIGTRCVIGAGSVLVRPADDKGVYAGNPAKLIKNI